MVCAGVSPARREPLLLATPGHSTLLLRVLFPAGWEEVWGGLLEQVWDGDRFGVAPQGLVLVLTGHPDPKPLWCPPSTHPDPKPPAGLPSAAHRVPAATSWLGRRPAPRSRPRPPRSRARALLGFLCSLHPWEGAGGFLGNSIPQSRAASCGRVDAVLQSRQLARGFSLLLL